MKFKLRVLPMKSFIIEVEAENEDDAYNKASAAMVDVELDMEIVP